MRGPIGAVEREEKTRELHLILRQLRDVAQIPLRQRVCSAATLQLGDIPDMQLSPLRDYEMNRTQAFLSGRKLLLPPPVGVARVWVP